MPNYHPLMYYAAQVVLSNRYERAMAHKTFPHPDADTCGGCGAPVFYTDGPLDSAYEKNETGVAVVHKCGPWRLLLDMDGTLSLHTDEERYSFAVIKLTQPCSTDRALDICAALNRIYKSG